MDSFIWIKMRRKEVKTKHNVERKEKFDLVWFGFMAHQTL